MNSTAWYESSTLEDLQGGGAVFGDPGSVITVTSSTFVATRAYKVHYYYVMLPDALYTVFIHTYMRHPTPYNTDMQYGGAICGGANSKITVGFSTFRSIIGCAATTTTRLFAI